MLVSIPDGYLDAVEKGGRLVRFEYDAHSPFSGKPLKKGALVYLPYGYDDERFDVFYYMHGGGGDCNEVFGGLNGTSGLKSLLDNMIARGDIKPVIVVAPTYLCGEGKSAAEETLVFWRELCGDLIPAVDSAFRTLRGREHRAFGGFSMGAEATWNVFANGLSELKYFLPMSGDCWAVKLRGGMECPDETAICIAEKVKASGYGDSFRVFAATGDMDIAFEPMSGLIAAMRRLPDLFTPDNLDYSVQKGGWHSYDWCRIYVYNGLKDFFAK